MVIDLNFSKNSLQKCEEILNKLNDMKNKTLIIRKNNIKKW